MPEIKEFCHAIMKAVVETGIITDTNQTEACEIMKDEVKAFFFGKKYETQRECVRFGSIAEDYIIADIVTECVSRLK